MDKINIERYGYRYGTEFNDRKNWKDDRIFCIAISFVLFSADVIRDGGPVYHRPVWGSGRYYGSLQRRSGYAYADCDHRGTCHGNHCDHRKVRRSRKAGGRIGVHWQYSDIFYGIIYCAYGGSDLSGKTDCDVDRDSCGGGSRDEAISSGMFYRYPVYHGIQYYQCDLPGTW